MDQCHHRAFRTCFRLLPAVIGIMKHHAALSEESLGGTGLFKWDTNLVRDGCFFAGILAASYDEGNHNRFLADDLGIKEEDIELSLHSHFEADDGVEASLAALREMRWILSNSDERQNTIHSMYEARHHRRFQHRQESLQQPRTIDMNYGQHSPMYPVPRVSQAHLPTTPKVVFHPAAIDRPLLPPLILTDTSRRVHSAPSTAMSTSSDSSGWALYTPPSTANSVGTGVSSHSSFPSPHGYKPDSAMDDASYYHLHNELSQFQFNPPSSMPSPVIVNDSLAPYHLSHRPSHQPGPVHASPTNSSYVDAGVHFPPSTLSHSPVDDSSRGCAPYVDDHCGYY